MRSLKTQRRNSQFYIGQISTVLLFLFYALIPHSIVAQGEELFRISRDKDKHHIVYHLNIGKNGRLNEQEPVAAYWNRVDIAGEESSRSLNVLERKYAYGLDFFEDTPDGRRFGFVSYDRDLFLKHSSQGYSVMIEVDGKFVILKELVLFMGRGSFWLPEIRKIEVIAFDTELQKEVKETIHDPK